MSLNELKTLKNEKGFTIVELLIVIVVIGILAAIVIVAYNGVTQSANTASAKGNAESVQKVAEAYNADETKNSYPSGADAAAVVTALTGFSGVTKIPSGVTVQTADPTSANGKNTVSYKVTGTTTAPTGGCVGWYDFTNKKLQYTGVGAATINNAAATATCS